MTLDEAIKHAEEVADTCEYEASKYDMNDSYESHVACQNGKCAEEHRQLAEWLKDYKRLLEQEPCDDAISREMALKECHDIVVDGERYRVIQEETLLGLPPVTQNPGKWIKDECGNVICSECKRFRRDCRYGHTNYCNHCGAKMESEDEK